MAGKDKCLSVCLWESGEPQREHAASPPGQRYSPSGAGVRLRFRDNQLASRNHSVLPFEIQVSATKRLSLARTQTGIKTDDEERKQCRTSARSADRVQVLLVFVKERLANVMLLPEPI